MKISLLIKILLLVLFLPSALFAQDITGLWKGEIYVDSTRKTLPYEISISEVNGKLIGYSLIIFEEAGKLETGTRDIIIDKKGDKIVITDISLLDNSFKVVPPKNIKKTMELTLSVKDNIMTLEGNWTTNRTKRFLAASGSVKLLRNTNFKETGLYKKLNNLGLTDKLVFKEPMQVAVHDIIKIDSNKIVSVPSKLNNPDEAKVAQVSAAVKKEIPIIVAPKIERELIATTIIPQKKELAPIIETPTKPLALMVKNLPIKSIAPAVIVKDKEVSSVIIVKNKPVSVPIIVKVKPVATAVPVEKNTVIAPVKETPIELVAQQNKNKLVQAEVIQKPVANITLETPKISPSAIVESKQPELTAPGIQGGAADINKRSIASTQAVFFQSDSLVLTLYDNGYVDGDTVSVVMNGNLIFSKQGLSTKPVSKTIHIDQNTPDSLLLVMYAENLGSIPPNTGLLVVHDGEAIYDVRFSADLSTNAAIILRRKKILP